MKVIILVWLVVQNKLLPVDNLGKKNIAVHPKCVFCHTYDEIAFHQFVTSPTLDFIWDFWKNRFSFRSNPRSCMLGRQTRKVKILKGLSVMRYDDDYGVGCLERT